MVRKRYRLLSRLGLLKHWLEFHIFLCTLGPILVLFHTAFKFGGLVAISFWSMVAVFLSGVIGRFIYIQIPRSIEGRELSLNEVREMKSDVAGIVRKSYNLDEESYNILADSIKKKVELYHKYAIVRYTRKYFDDRKTIKTVKTLLKKNNLKKDEYKKILALVKNDIKLNRRIERLDTMQNLFKYWHVVHSPFALVMLIIMIIHVAVTIAFGYRWIF
jgi:sulfur relay (sulfurtransferase) DsrC/TusE family protein